MVLEPIRLFFSRIPADPQYGLLDVRLHWSAKFALATVCTLAVSFASYQALVRHTVIGRLLDGKLTVTARRPATAGSV